MRAVVLSTLLVLSVVTGCSQRHPVSIAAPAPPPAPIQRTLIETPLPALLPEPLLPALKPGTELSLPESEALADQASPKAPLETQLTASQRAIGRAEAEGHTINSPAASAEAPPVTDVAHLVGLSQTDATKLFGVPAERRNLPPSEIWTYHSTVCDVKLFFYPEVGGPDFRALTFQIDERGASDATHNACLSSLVKLPAG